MGNESSGIEALDFHKRKHKRRWWAFLALEVFLFSLFLPLAAGLRAQPVLIPNLKTRGFQSNDMRPYYSAAAGALNEAQWRAIIDTGLDTVYAAWEASVDQEINTLTAAAMKTADADAFKQINAQGTTNDKTIVNKRSAYRQYVLKGLRDQKTNAASKWQLAAENTIQQRRMLFLTGLANRTIEKQRQETNKTARLNNSSTGGMQDQVDGDSRIPDGGKIDYDRRTELMFRTANDRIDLNEYDWKRDWRDRLTQGEFEYTQALNILADQRAAFMGNLNAATTQWRDNIAAAKLAEQNTRNGLGDVLDDLDKMLAGNPLFHQDVACESDRMTSCPVTPGDTSRPLNTAGQEMKQRIIALCNALKDGKKLSGFVATMQTTLKEMKTYALERGTYWTNLSTGTGTYERRRGNGAFNYITYDVSTPRPKGPPIVETVRKWCSPRKGGTGCEPRKVWSKGKLKKKGDTQKRVVFDPEKGTYTYIYKRLKKIKKETIGYGKAARVVETPVYETLEENVIGNAWLDVCSGGQTSGCLNFVDHNGDAIDMDWSRVEGTRDVYAAFKADTGDKQYMKAVIPAGHDTRDIIAITKGDVCGGTPTGDVAGAESTSNHTCYSNGKNSGYDAWFNMKARCWECGSREILGLFGDKKNQTWQAKEKKIKIKVSYNWEDAAAKSNAETWRSYADEINTVILHWQNEIQPSVEAWEKQVIDYKAAFQEWKKERNRRRDNYNTAYAKARADLINGRNTFRAGMEDEQRRGKRKFTMSRADLKKLEGEYDNLKASRKTGAGPMDGNTAAQFAERAAAIVRNARVASFAIPDVAGQLTDAIRNLPGLENSFLTAARNGLPDITRLDGLLASFAKAAGGMMNLAAMRGMEEAAQRMRDQSIQRIVEMLEGQNPPPKNGMPRSAYGRYKVEVDGQGNITATRTIYSGAAHKIDGKTGKKDGHYRPGTTKQKLHVTAPPATALQGYGDLFSSWDMNEVLNKFSAELGANAADAGSRDAMVQGLMQSNDAYAHARVAKFQKNRTDLVMEANRPSGFGQLMQGLAAVAAVAGAFVTGGASLAIYATAMGAAGAAQGAMEGGWKGALLGGLSGAVSAYTGAAGINVGLSYSYEDGFGGSLGLGVGGATVGLNYSQGDGLGGNLGMKVAGGAGLNLSYSGDEGFSGGIAYKGSSGAVGLNYSEQGGLGAHGGVVSQDGLNSAGLSYTETGGLGGYGGRGDQKLTYTQEDGIGVSLSAGNAQTGAGTLSISQHGGLSASLKQNTTFENGNSISNSVAYNSQNGLSATSTSRSASGNSVTTRASGSGLTATGQAASVVSGVDGVRADPVASITSLDSLMGATDAIGEKLRVKYMQEQRKKLLAGIMGQDVSGLDDQQIQDRLKQIARSAQAQQGGDSGTVGGFYEYDRSSRDEFGFLENMVAAMGDDLSAITGNISDKNGYIDAAGVYHQRVCFTAGTLVRTRDGYRKIEEIRPGDIVRSWNEKTGRVNYNRVVQTFTRRTKAIYHISYADGTVIETTWNHPFYIEGRGWVKAKDLRARDRSMTLSAAAARETSPGATDMMNPIASIRVENRTETVYNFTVENDHTYFVSRADVLVHNQNYQPVRAGEHAWYDTDKSPAEQELRKILDAKAGSIFFEKGLITSSGKRVMLSIPGQEPIILSGVEDLKKLVDGATSNGNFESLGDIDRGGSLKDFLEKNVNTYYSGFAGQGGSEGAKNQIGQGDFNYAQTIQYKSEKKQWEDMHGEGTFKPKKGWECRGSAAINMYKSLGLVSPEITREEFERRYSNLHDNATDPDYQMPRGYSEALRYASKQKGLPAMTPEAFAKIANGLVESDWAKLTGMGNKHFIPRNVTVDTLNSTINVQHRPVHATLRESNGTIGHWVTATRYDQPSKQLGSDDPWYQNRYNYTTNSKDDPINDWHYGTRNGDMWTLDFY